ncbi:hypothetical protein VKT23_011608 [Stygiomarasmius scandens]|uniref:Thiaminase-2/PQQC domain-containing protein n=1 Tax=Marasmiellus scandens TaxID=2682957 RepID=A0ABR1J986_9AGAR
MDTLINTLFKFAEDPHAELVISTIIHTVVNLIAKDKKSFEEFLEKLEDEAQPENKEIDKLWNDIDNQDVVTAFMENKLCVEAAQDKENARAAYKRYAVQDYFYLLDSVRFKALRFATLPYDDFDLDKLDQEIKSVTNSTGYARDWFITCVEQLGVSEEDFRVERSIAELAYSQYLQNNAQGDDWYNLHVVLIGCYWGWCKLALDLYQQPTTKKDTAFYKTWILPNVDTTDPNRPDFTKSAKVLSKFLDQNAAIMTSELSRDKAKHLFRTTLRLEVSLFESAYMESVSKPSYSTLLGRPAPNNGHQQQKGQFLINVMRSMTYDELKKKVLFSKFPSKYSFHFYRKFVSDHDNVRGSWVQSKNQRSYILGIDFTDPDQRHRYGVEFEILEVQVEWCLFEQQVQVLEFPGHSGKNGFVVGLAIEDCWADGTNGWWCIGRELRLGTKNVKVEIKTEGSRGMHVCVC